MMKILQEKKGGNDRQRPELDRHEHKKPLFEAIFVLCLVFHGFCHTTLTQSSHQGIGLKH